MKVSEASAWVGRESLVIVKILYPVACALNLKVDQVLVNALLPERVLKMKDLRNSRVIWSYGWYALRLFIYFEYL
jgi:hypothetical protein